MYKEIPESFKENLRLKISIKSNHQINAEFDDANYSGKYKTNMYLLPKGEMPGNYRFRCLPTIEISKIYSDFLNKNISIDEICEKAINFYNKNLHLFDQINLCDYETCKKHFGIFFINSVYNPRKFSDKLIKENIDGIYAIGIIKMSLLSGSGIEYIEIDEDMIKSWNKTKEEVMIECLLNAFDIEDTNIIPWLNLYNNPIHKDWVDSLSSADITRFNKEKVVKNKDDIYGTVKMFNPDILDMLYKIIKKDFFVLPESIDSFSAMPISNNENLIKEYKKRNKRLIIDNSRFIDPEYIVKDHIYIYSGKEKSLYYLDKNENPIVVDISKYSIENLKKILETIKHENKEME